MEDKFIEGYIEGYEIEGYEAFDEDEIPLGPLSWEKGAKEWWRGYNTAKEEAKEHELQEEFNEEAQEISDVLIDIVDFEDETKVNPERLAEFLWRHGFRA